jgi:APA family basic amino acid/polyamine antiporter
MVGCTLIYMVVALAAVGAMNYTVFGQSPEPLALIMRELGHGAAAKIVAAAAVVALPTVLLAFFYGQSRIFFVMSRDGLLPRSLSKVGKRGTPVTITIFTALVTASLAGVARLDEIAALANAGTLVAFVAVATCMLVLRKRDPARPRVFRAPMAWLVGPVAILGCIYLFSSLPTRTQLWCLLWNVFGLLVYVAYARRNSLLAKPPAA